MKYRIKQEWAVYALTSNKTVLSSKLPIDFRFTFVQKNKRYLSSGKRNFLELDFFCVEPCSNTTNYIIGILSLPFNLPFYIWDQNQYRSESNSEMVETSGRKLSLISIMSQARYEIIKSTKFDQIELEIYFHLIESTLH